MMRKGGGGDWGMGRGCLILWIGAIRVSLRAVIVIVIIIVVAVRYSQKRAADSGDPQLKAP